MDNLTNKDKIDMLEKEANLLLKEFLAYLMMIGSVIVFLLEKITITPLKQFDAGLFFIFGLIAIIGAILFAFLFSNFLIWFFDNIKRINEIKNKIKRINDDIR